MNQQLNGPEKTPIVKPRGVGLRDYFYNYCSKCGVKSIYCEFEIDSKRFIGCDDPKQCDWNKILNNGIK
jgi:hypothetical protein